MHSISNQTIPTALSTARSVVLQPHHDDLIFNGSKLLADAVIPLPAVVVAVFSRSTHLVRSLPAKSIDEVSAIRHNEDAVVWSHFPGVSALPGLGFCDLPDRARTTATELLVPLIEREIIRLIRELSASFLVVQVVDRHEGHLDHRITLSAAAAAVSRMDDIELVLIGDAPYSAAGPRRPDLLDFGYRPRRLLLSRAEIGRKHRMMELYSSQMRSRFHDFVERHPSETIWLQRHWSGSLSSGWSRPGLATDIA